MSCDFEPKMVVSYIDRRSMYAESNRKQKVSKRRKLKYLKDGYLGFTFFNFDPQSFKKQFFWERCSKIHFFEIFKNVLYVGIGLASE